jgi:subtilisin family serine protease
MRDAPAPLLVRFVGASPAITGPSLAAAGIDLEPLFFAPTGSAGLSAAVSGAHWCLARIKSADTSNAWDHAHQAAERLATMGLAAGPSGVDVVEPDLVQGWLHEPPQAAETFAAAADVCAFDDQDRDVPFRAGEFAWHLGDGFTQLRAARLAAAGGDLIRVAHLDTGYDPEHASFAAGRMDLALQRNFAGGNESDARDPGVEGRLRNPGHGTGTLSILAGGRFRFAGAGYAFDDELGGAGDVRVVPVRVGNSVVQLTTSSVARGISYAADLCNDPATRVDVMTMSMGGVASAAWADAVNLAYEAGIVFVAAAGNNISAGLFGFPTRQIVYPARFRRVIAACGVMADRTPYYGLRVGAMQGNWGPAAAMATAMAAFTPNIAWARWGCPEVVRMNGAGTSSATPQIAAAAALYFQAHPELFDRSRYPEAWMRVEAVRLALFQSADRSADGGSPEKLGNGILRAADALDVAPADPASLTMTRRDSAGFPFLNVLSRRGLTMSAEDRMLQLEAAQLVHRWPLGAGRNPLEAAVADPEGQPTPQEVQGFLEALRDHPEASKSLKRRANDLLGARDTPGGGPASGGKPSLPPPARHTPFTPPTPPYRCLQSYAVDPRLAAQLDSVQVSQVTLKLPWEELDPGPVGEYLEVVDVDPASDCCYEPVKLDDPILLAQDGLPPAEGVPQFHQQMVYAVCSLTIKNFEKALGRKALWRHGPPPAGANRRDDSHFVRRLRVHPHALREANAYYSPNKVALLFGYFDARSDDPAQQLPGGRVFTCLSHDIIAHETTHALLDGMHRQFLLPSNPDVHAFHEGFADCVAMLQHFTFPDLVAHQISATRGSIDSQENLLVQLAGQFGRATGMRAALRDAIGVVRPDSTKPAGSGANDAPTQGVKWEPREVDPTEYSRTMESHARGRILVSAVFDAFLSIYRRRTSDLLRLATGGSGVLHPGAIHPDLVARLASEASKSAQHVLNMCIRALDYSPPTDITFGEYLRAVVTADHDLVPDDDLNYRVSFVEAFRKRGIFAPGVRGMSVENLLWRTPEEDDRRPSSDLMHALRELRGELADFLFTAKREEVFKRQRSMRAKIHEHLEDLFRRPDGARDAEFLGLELGPGGEVPRFEVHSARVAFRNNPDGGVTPQFLLGLLQATDVPVDPKDPGGPTMRFEGGCTVVADLRALKFNFCIRKRVNHAGRLAAQQEFALREFDSLQATYLGTRGLDGAAVAEPFALIHRGA